MTPKQQARRLFDEIQTDDEVYSCRIIAAALTEKDDEIERLKQRAADLERCLKICGGELKDDGNLLVRTDKFNKALAAAKIEGLKMFHSKLRYCPGLDEIDCIKACHLLDAEIAKIEKGER